jgi:hypothetical protein
LGQVPINTDFISLLLVPSSRLLPAWVHALYMVPIQYPVWEFRSGAGVRARSQSDLSACCWSLITAAVAYLGADLYTGPNPVSC